MLLERGTASSWWVDVDRGYPLATVLPPSYVTWVARAVRMTVAQAVQRWSPARPQGEAGPPVTTGLVGNRQ
jgi:hypothetical protein